jgi:hypothetical protein
VFQLDVWTTLAVSHGRHLNSAVQLQRLLKGVVISWTPHLLPEVSGWKVQASRNSASACAAMAACERRRWASDASSSRPCACAKGVAFFHHIAIAPNRASAGAASQAHQLHSTLLSKTGPHGHG